jgi:hypothetical protein
MKEREKLKEAFDEAAKDMGSLPDWVKNLREDGSRFVDAQYSCSPDKSAGEQKQMPER